MPSIDSLKTLQSLEVDGETYHYYSLPDAEKELDFDLDPELEIEIETKPVLLAHSVVKRDT